MKMSSRAPGSRSLSLALLAAIIGALCFSVNQTQAPNIVGARSFENTSVAKYGRLDVPTQAQKRSKRPVVDFACASPGGTHKIVPPSAFLIAREPVEIGSVLFVARPSGRAPPFVS